MSTKKTKPMMTESDKIIENFVKTTFEKECKPCVRRFFYDFPLKYLRLMENVFSPIMIFVPDYGECVIVNDVQFKFRINSIIEIYLDKNNISSCKLGDINLKIESPELKKLCSLLGIDDKYEFFKNEIKNILECYSDYEVSFDTSKDLRTKIKPTKLYKLYHDLYHDIEINWHVVGDFIYISFLKEYTKFYFMCPLDFEIDEKK